MHLLLNFWITKRKQQISACDQQSAVCSCLESLLNVSVLCLSDPLVQICIDDSRNVLYTRSEKGTIQVKSWSITC